MTRRSWSVGCAVLFFALAFPRIAPAFAEFSEFTKSEFSPARGERFQIPVALQEDAEVKIDIFTADGDLVRTIAADKPLGKGAHKLAWDGKDQDGVAVPDEAYIAVLRGSAANGKTISVDSRETSGGEIIDDLQVQITADGQIAYTLPAPSRVLIRAGIKGGPMMRSLANWEPRVTGKNVQRWDGFDQSRLIDLRAEKNMTLLVTAFRLPRHSIITTGNSKLSYADYRKQRQRPTRVVKPEQIVLHRGEHRLARQYYVSPERAMDPPVQLRFPGELKKSASGLPVIKAGQQVRVTVDVDDAHRWLVDESLYEVAFFVDHGFVSEEEQGYVPLTWLWTVDELKPGRHLFTVNISGFDGKVGAVSALFEVVK